MYNFLDEELEREEQAEGTEVQSPEGLHVNNNEVNAEADVDEPDAENPKNSKLILI